MPMPSKQPHASTRDGTYPSLINQATVSSSYAYATTALANGTYLTHTHHHKDEMRALMEVASFITAAPLILCYPTNPVIATGRPDYRG